MFLLRYARGILRVLRGWAELEVRGLSLRLSLGKMV